jgi:hypothetical protein
MSFAYYNKLIQFKAMALSLIKLIRKHQILVLIKGRKREVGGGEGNNHLYHRGQ